MAENEKTTELYWKAAGLIVLGVGIGYLFSNRNKSKKSADTMNHLTAKAELDRITSEPPKDANTQVTVEPQDKVMSGEMRTSAFTQDKKEDVAAPTIIKVEPKQEATQNDTGSLTIPVNAYAGKMNNGMGFEEGDVIYSLGNQDAKIARAANGQYSFTDKNGNGLGAFKANHRQKLGVVTVKEPNGVYFKAAPDFKKYGFIGYEKIYKLT